MSQSFHPVILAAGASGRISHLTRHKPKSFLEVGGRKVIDYTFDYLLERGIRRATVVVGYLKEIAMKTLGDGYQGLSFDYVVDDRHRGHCWSIYLTKTLWERTQQPLLLIHADILYDARILDKVLSSSYDDVLAVDNHYTIRTSDELLVQGKNSVVTGVKKYSPHLQYVVGETLGINRWSPSFMRSFYQYMETFFQKHGQEYNWEPVLDAYLQEKSPSLHYVTTDGLPWININYEEDYQIARDVVYPALSPR